MVGVYTNNVSIIEFHEYLVLLRKYKIDTKKMKFYNPRIVEDNRIIIESNLNELVEDIKKHNIGKVIIFLSDNISKHDIHLIKDITTNNHIPLIFF